MQVIDDIWSSIKGNTVARVRDPIIGTFIVSWALCNWDKLGLLFFGSGVVDARVATLSKSMGILANPGLIFTDIDLILIPLFLTAVYLFVLPKLSLKVKGWLEKTYIAQHNQAVDLDIEKSGKQRELNKAHLRANPEKEFLSKELELELELAKDKMHRRKRLTEYIDKKASAAEAQADEVKSSAESAKIELERKKRQEEHEKQKHSESSAIHKASLAANRFPAVYMFLDLLAKSLAQDNVILSLESLSDSVAAIFGYDSFSDLTNDDSFNNENAAKLEYIYHDSEFLAKRLAEILEKEDSENEDANSDLVFDHIYGLFEHLPYELLSGESLAEKIGEKVNEDSYDMLNSEELSGPIAESNTMYEEVELGVENYDFSTGFTVQLLGSASGSHYRESDVPGRDLSINATAYCKPILGKFGLADYELEVKGSLDDYWEDEAIS
jgi:hypothetical protein